METERVPATTELIEPVVAPQVPVAVPASPDPSVAIAAARLAAPPRTGRGRMQRCATPTNVAVTPPAIGRTADRVIRRSPAPAPSITPVANGDERIQRSGSKKQARQRGKQQQRARQSRRAQRSRRRRQPATAPPVEVTSAPSAFARLAPLLDLAAPTPGDSGGVEASAKIVLDPTGSTFLQFDLSGEVERSDDGLEAGFDVAVGYGGSITSYFGLTPEIVGKLGGFVEASGTTAADVLELLSYGYYRQFREASWVPREAADYLWGSDGSGSGADASATWSAEVEKRQFADNENAAVSMGLYGAATAEIGLSADEDDKLGVEAKVSSATTYSKESLESSAANGGSQLGVVDKERNNSTMAWLSSWVGRGEQRSVGEVERKLELSAEASYGPFSGELSFSMALSLDSTPDYEFGLSGSGELSAAERRPDKIADLVARHVGTARKIVGYLRSEATTSAQFASVFTEAADTIGRTIDGYEQQREALAEQLAGKIGGKGKRAVEFSVSIERESGTVERGFSLAYVSEVEVKGDVIAASGEAKASRKRVLYSSDDWPVA